MIQPHNLQHRVKWSWNIKIINVALQSKRFIKTLNKGLNHTLISLAAFTLN